MIKRRIKTIISILLCAIFILSGTVRGSAIAEGSNKEKDPSLQIVNLTTNNLENPQGLDVEVPTFGWCMESNLMGQHQTAYQMVVTDLGSGAVVWDSEKVEGSVSQYIMYKGEMLDAEKDYMWQVTVYDKNDCAYTSDPAYFSTGLMMQRFQEADEKLTQFTIEADFTIAAGCFGLLFSVEDNDNFFMWQVNAGSMSINPHSWSNGSINTNYEQPSIREALGVDSILDMPMHMIMQMDDGTVTTWINDIQIGDPIYIGKLELGGIGFRQTVNEHAAVEAIAVYDVNGNVLFEDDFEDPSVVKFSGGQIENGQLVMNNSGLVFEAGYTEPVSSFTIDFHGEIVSDAMSLLFAGQGDTNFLMWQMNAKHADGDFGVFKPHSWFGSPAVLEEKPLDEFFGSDFILLGTKYHMMIEVDEGRIDTYLQPDGYEREQISSLTVTTPFTLGKLGFRQIRDNFDDGDDEVGMVDYIKVTSKDGEVLFEDDFTDSSNPSFERGSYTPDGRLRVENGLFFQAEQKIPQKPEEIPGWGDARWISTQEIGVTAGKIPNYNISFKMQFQPGSTKMSALLCGNDSRLLDKTKNDFRVEGENYIEVELDASDLLSGGNAQVRIGRKGVHSDDYKYPDNTQYIQTFTVSSYALSEADLYNPIEIGITSPGGELQIYVNGNYIGSRIINPSNAIQDRPCYSYLNEVGFKTDAGQALDVYDYKIEPWGDAEGVLFSENIGAAYEIFEGLDGIEVDGSVLHIGGNDEAKVLADPSYGAAPMLRREFSADQAKEIKQARLYITSRGIYEAYVNGTRIGEDWFNPGYTQYDKTINYATYDITEQVKNGENAIGVKLASGWWSDMMTFMLTKYNYFGNNQALLAKIAVTYADGSQDIIDTDETWEANIIDNPIVYAGYFNGETYDARKEAGIEGWDVPGYSESGNWEQAVLFTPQQAHRNPKIVSRIDDPVRHIETLDAVFSSEPDPNVYVYDMGSNMVGVPEIKLPQGSPGQEIIIRFSEIYYPLMAEYGELAGKLLTENLRACLFTDTYIMKGTPGGEIYRPSFTFHGYQYIEITGLDQPLPEENIKGIVLSSIQETTSTYDSSNELTNQLHKNIQRSLYGNHVSIPTDCPQRDERMGWTGDAQVFARTATYYGNMNTMYEGWERSIRDCQSNAGWVPDVIPNLGFGVNPNVAWPAAIIINTWETYKQYGNTRLVEDHLEAMELFLRAMGSDRMSGRKYLTDGDSLAEHLALVGTDQRLCSNVYYAYMLEIFAKMCEGIGEMQLADHYGELAVHVKQEWNEVFIDTVTGKTKNRDGGIQDTQASYALAIEFGVISDENLEKASQLLVEACQRGYNGVPYTITTGFVGTAPLLPALTRSGKLEDSYKMYEQTEFASWLYPVTQGATSIWERWNGYTIENGFGGQNYMNSFNHYAAGAVGAWMVNYHIGITSDEDDPGFQKFILQPMPGGDFTYVNGSYDSIYGNIVSNWKATAGKMTAYYCEVPANTSAKLYLPVSQLGTLDLADGIISKGMTIHNEISAAEFELQPGGYDFIITDTGITATLGEGYVPDGGGEPEPGQADKSTLEKVIARAQKAIDDGELEAAVPSVQASFQKAFSEAAEVMDRSSATQEEVDNAWSALLHELHRLGILAGDKTILADLVNEAKKLIADKDKYTPDSIKILEEALQDAQNVIDDADATPKEVETVWEALDKAIKDLKEKEIPSINKAKLKALIDEAEAYNKDDYVTAGWQEFSEVLAEAITVYKNENATQEEVTKAWETLLDCILELRYKADKALLNKAVNEAVQIDRSIYTPASLSVLDKALANARELLANSELSEDDQTIVDEATDQVNKALRNLEKISDIETDDTEETRDTSEETKDTSEETKDTDADETTDTSSIGTEGTSSRETEDQSKSNGSQINNNGKAPKTGDKLLIAEIFLLLLSAGVILISRKRYRK